MNQTGGWFRANWRGLLKTVLILVVVGLVGVCGVNILVLYAWSNPPRVSYRAALVDIDSDGDLDALMANGINEGKTESTLWINQGGAQGGRMGTFTDSGQRLGSAEYRSLAAGDLDNDGDQDVLLGNVWWGLEMFINQGGAQSGQVGQLKSASTLRGGEYWGGLHPIGLGDLDGDGDLDILTGSCCGGFMPRENGEGERLPASNWLFTNQLAEAGLSEVTKWPSYQSAMLAQEVEDGTEALALGDLDSDGDLDAFLAKTIEQFGPNNAYVRRTFYRVWWNDGKGHFQPAELNLETPNIADLALGDLDGDGDLDVLAATSRNGGQVVIQRGGKPGQFAIQPGSLGTGILTTILLGDLNGDGSLDALLGGQNQTQVWWNDGQGHFKAGQALRYIPRYSAAAFGDVDGDGDLDIFVGKLAEEYQVWQNDGQGKFSR